MSKLNLIEEFKRNFVVKYESRNNRPLLNLLKKLVSGTNKSNVPEVQVDVSKNASLFSGETQKNKSFQSLNILSNQFKSLFGKFYNWFFISDTPKFSFSASDLSSVVRAGISSIFSWILLIILGTFGNFIFSIILGIVNERVVLNTGTTDILLYVMVAMLFQAFRRWLGSNKK